MKSKPSESIIINHDNNKDLCQVFDKCQGLLKEIVNYSSNILEEYTSKLNEDENYLPVIMLFRRAIELTDSISELIKHGIADPCYILVRSLLEVYFSIDFMLDKNTNERAKGFIIWNAYNDLKTYEKLDIKTSQGKQFNKKLKNDKMAGEMDISNLPNIEDAKNKARTIINNSKYQQINSVYTQMKNDNKRLSNWFNLFNINTIEQLAEKSNLYGVYNILYRNFSGYTHGTNIIKGNLLKAGDNLGLIVPIRYPKNIQEVTQHTANVLLICTNKIISQMGKDKKRDFAYWYMLKIQKFYISLIKNKLIKFE